MNNETLYATYRKWRSRGLLNRDGIVVGSDQTQEWLLPWWWDRYRKYNSHPVTFVDFGMTLSAREWCKERGELVRLLVADVFVVKENELDPALIDKWEGIYGKRVWDARHAWFVKPLACLQSPYRRSIWIDLDCEVRRPLDPLFDFCEHPSGISMTRDFGAKDANYTSGVIAYKRGLPLIEEWAHQAFTRNQEFPGDQDLLTAILFEKKLEIQVLPDIYNWSRSFPDNSNAAIVHYHGQIGKVFIAYQLNPYASS